MSNYWKQSGIPHKGWTLTDVIDVRENGEEEWEAEYETCMMCGNERIRYIHIVSHQEVNSDFRVGCICAMNMTEDYINPKAKETALRNKANRRTNWLKKEWKKNKKGNIYLKYDHHYLLIYKDGDTDKYKVKLDETFGGKSFDTISQAKNAAYNGVEYFKKKGDW